MSSATRRRHTGISTDEVVASFVVMLLSTVTAIAMCRVFADWVFVRPLLMVAVVIHVASTLLRIAREIGRAHV